MSHKKAFTLVELLVVIAIISVLAALLLPALESALTQARLAACGQQLRQVGVAHSMYTQDFDDHFVIFWTNSRTHNTAYEWVDTDITPNGATGFGFLLEFNYLDTITQLQCLGQEEVTNNPHYAVAWQSSATLWPTSMTAYIPTDFVIPSDRIVVEKPPKTFHLWSPSTEQYQREYPKVYSSYRNHGCEILFADAKAEHGFYTPKAVPHKGASNFCMVDGSVTSLPNMFYENMNNTEWFWGGANWWAIAETLVREK